MVTGSAGTLMPFALSSTRRPRIVLLRTLLNTRRTEAAWLRARAKSTASSASQISAGDGDVTTRTAFALRTAVVKDGQMYVQAGGGVVADSNGPYEYNESSKKAEAVLAAIAAAETLSEP